MIFEPFPKDLGTIIQLKQPFLKWMFRVQTHPHPRDQLVELQFVARCVSTTSTISQLCPPCRLGMATRLAAAIFKNFTKCTYTLRIQSPCQMMIGVYNMYSHLLSKIFRFHSFFFTSTFKSGCQLNPSGMVNSHPETEPLPAPKLEGDGIEKWIRRTAETSWSH